MQIAPRDFHWDVGRAVETDSNSEEELSFSLTERRLGGVPQTWPVFVGQTYSTYPKDGRRGREREKKRKFESKLARGVASCVYTASYSIVMLLLCRVDHVTDLWLTIESLLINSTFGPLRN